MVNVLVGKLDREEKPDAGNRLDLCLRWIFPIAYLKLVLIPLVVGRSY